MLGNEKGMVEEKQRNRWIACTLYVYSSRDNMVLYLHWYMVVTAAWSDMVRGGISAERSYVTILRIIYGTP